MLAVLLVCWPEMVRIGVETDLMLAEFSMTFGV